MQGHVDLVGIVGDGRLLLEVARELRPDVIVADIAMPLLSGLEALRRLTAARLDAKVCVLTDARRCPRSQPQARAPGASGYVLTHAAGARIFPGAAPRYIFGPASPDISALCTPIPCLYNPA